MVKKTNKTRKGFRWSYLVLAVAIVVIVVGVLLAVYSDRIFVKPQLSGDDARCVADACTMLNSRLCTGNLLKVCTYALNVPGVYCSNSYAKIWDTLEICNGQCTSVHSCPNCDIIPENSRCTNPNWFTCTNHGARYTQCKYRADLNNCLALTPGMCLMGTFCGYNGIAENPCKPCPQTNACNVPNAVKCLDKKTRGWCRSLSENPSTCYTWEKYICPKGCDPKTNECKP